MFLHVGDEAALSEQCLPPSARAELELAGRGRCERSNPHPTLDMIVGRPMSCVPGYFEVINTHTVGFLTIPRASIKWV